MAFERRAFSPAAAPTTLATDIDNAAVSLTVQDGSTYVDGSTGKSVLTLDRGKSNEERVLYTTRLGNVFSGLTRGYNGTAAQAHSAGSIVEHTSTQQDFDEANSHASDAVHSHAYKDTVNTFTGKQTFSGGIGGAVQADNADHYFGANAAGGAGTRIHLGSLGDPNNAFVTAEGSGADVGLVLRTKGAGGVFVQSAVGVSRASVDSNGVVSAIGANHYFGANAFGGAGTRVRLSADGANGFVMAEGSVSNPGLILRSKGTGNVEVQSAAGDHLLTVTPGDPGSGNTVAALSVHSNAGWNTAPVSLGAADSGGTGYRVLRVAN